jgi:hypothetical protein
MGVPVFGIWKSSTQLCHELKTYSWGSMYPLELVIEDESIHGSHAAGIMNLGYKRLQPAAEGSQRAIQRLAIAQSISLRTLGSLYVNSIA